MCVCKSMLMEDAAWDGTERDGTLWRRGAHPAENSLTYTHTHTHNAKARIIKIKIFRHTKEGGKDSRRRDLARPRSSLCRRLLFHQRFNHVTSRTYVRPPPELNWTELHQLMIEYIRTIGPAYYYYPTTEQSIEWVSGSVSTCTWRLRPINKKWNQ